MKREQKKNNKGFSLVELIVVVLIMAIIAVALAPQVMKWVNNSRISTDVSTYDSMVASIQLALADEPTYAAVKGVDDITVTITSAGVAFSNGTTAANTALDNKLILVVGSNYKTTTKAKVSTGSYVITVNKGAVERTTPPSDTLE